MLLVDILVLYLERIIFVPTLDAFDPTQYYINVSKTLEKLGYDVYLRGLCLLCDDGGWENVFFVVPRVNHRNPLVGGEFTIRLDMRGKENGNASLVRSEFSLRRVAATSGDSSLVREFEDESSRGNRNLVGWLSEVADVSGGVYPTRLALVAHRVMVAAGIGPGEWV